MLFLKPREKIPTMEILITLKVELMRKKRELKRLCHQDRRKITRIHIVRVLLQQALK
jgi:hypothetical protein